MHSKHSLISDFLKYLSLLIASFVVLFPIYTIFVGAFKSRTEYYTERFSLPANFFNFENFRAVFERGQLGLGFWNIGVIIVLSIIGNVLLGTMAAYALGRFDFKLKKLIMGLYLVASVIPLVTTQVATFSIIQNLGLYNTLYAPILLYLGADVIQIVIYLQFVNSIPRALDESALIEGASLFKIYRIVIFPLLAPATATVVILKFISIYNDFYIPFLYMPSQKLRVVSTAIYSFVGPNAARMEVISAFILVVFIPTAVLFLLLQKYVFSGVTSGAVKE
jgi:raffinose/stachyose/melibiose transport system permease protein